MASPILLCGLGRTGTRALHYLRAAGLAVIVIDDRCRPTDPRLQGARLIQGDCRDRDLLLEAGVDKVRGVLVMTNDDLVNISTTLTVRGLNPAVRIVVRLFDQNLLDRLGQSIHNVTALSAAMLTAPVLAMTAMTGAAIGAFRIEGQPDGGRLVAELLVQPGDHLAGQPIADAVAPCQAVPLAHLPAQQPARLVRDVDPQASLHPNDLLVVCGQPRQLVPLLSGNLPGNGSTLRWAGWLRRHLRVLRNTLLDLDRAVLICAVVLLVVVLVSTLVLHFGVTKYRIPDALLRSVSIMATASSMHEEDYQDSPGIRVFVSVLRILGAVLMAAFTAIVTNYLLRARLGGALEVRRIPESGHLIVCGLGSIGFLTVEELVRYGERVVVIERDLANPFVSTARRQGVPVIIGDAALPEVQSQAHMAAAHAVIASTSNDLTNLSIALLARERSPQQRVIVVIADPQMAGMLRQAANVNLALSVPNLAAPAFLAALYGDRVLTVIMVRQHLLAVFDLVVQIGDPLVGLTLDEAAALYRFQTLASIPPADQAKLAVGQRLVVVVALADLERLLGRQPASGVSLMPVNSEGAGSLPA